MSNSLDEYMSDSDECLLAKLRSAPRRAPRAPQQSVAPQNTASRVSDSVADCGDSSNDRILETLLIKQQHKISSTPPAASRAPSTPSHAPPQTAAIVYDCGTLNPPYMYLAHPVFTLYRASGAVALKHYVTAAIRKLLGDAC